MHAAWQKLHEDVGDIVFSRNMDNDNVFIIDMFADKVVVDVNMFRSGVELIILSKGDHRWLLQLIPIEAKHLKSSLINKDLSQMASLVA